MTTKIVSGGGALEAVCGTGIKRAFVFCDPVIASSGMAQRLTGILEQSGIQYELDTGIVPDPSKEDILAGLQKMIPFEPDAVIALGGGSTLDTAKAAVFFYPEVTGKSKPTCVAIPTTSGTGSECTAFSILTDHARNMKDPLIDDRLLPEYAVLDAEFVRSVPPQVTADTGLDALTHAVESYVSVNAQGFTDALNEKAVKLIFQYLPRAFAAPDDMEAREKLHCASCMAGIAFSQTGLGMVHGMAHALGGFFHLTHGRSCALLLPAVVEYNAQIAFGKAPVSVAARKYAGLAGLLRGDSMSVPQGVGSLVRGIRSLSARVGISGGIGALQISRQDFSGRLDAMSRAAVRDRSAATNPRSFTEEDIRAVFLACF